MKVRNSFFEEGMNELKKLGDMDLPAAVSYQVVKGFKKLNELAQTYAQTKQKLLEKYGTLNEEGTAFTFTNETLPMFQKEMDDLLAFENEVKFEKVTLPKDVKVSAKFLMILEDFVEVER